MNKLYVKVTLIFFIIATSLIGCLFYYISTATLTTENDRYILYNILWIVIAIVYFLIVTLIILLNHYISKPINILKKQSTADMPIINPFQKIFSVPNDELIKICEDSAILLQTVYQLIHKTYTSKEMGMNISQNLSEKAFLTNDIVHDVLQIANSFKEMTSHLSDIVEKNATAVSEMSGSIEVMTNTISAESEAVKQSSTSIEMMTTSLDNIANKAYLKKESISKMSDRINQVQQSISEVVNSMGEIKKKSGTMLQIVEVIGKIADKTNLLAMNAAIEAAHAGQYGTGFKVVATEIKRLSEQSNSNAKQISGHIKDNLGQIDISADRGQEILSEFIEVVREISDTTDTMVDIINMVENLGRNNSQVINTFKKLVNVTEEVKSASQNMNDMRLIVVENLSHLIGIETNADDAAKNIVSKLNLIFTKMEEILQLTILSQESLDEIGYFLNLFDITENKVVFKSQKDFTFKIL